MFILMSKKMSMDLNYFEMKRVQRAENGTFTRYALYTTANDTIFTILFTIECFSRGFSI